MRYSCDGGDWGCFMGYIRGAEEVKSVCEVIGGVLDELRGFLERN